MQTPIGETLITLTLDCIERVGPITAIFQGYLISRLANANSLHIDLDHVLAVGKRLKLADDIDSLKLISENIPETAGISLHWSDSHLFLARNSAPIAFDWNPSHGSRLNLLDVGLTGPIIEQSLKDYVAETPAHFRSDSDFERFAMQYVCVPSISADWKPSAFAKRLLTQRGMPETVIEEATTEFVFYHKEAMTRRHITDRDFIAFATALWKRHRGKPRTIRPEWKPEVEVLQLLRGEGIPDCIIEQELAEFVLYWNETGHARSDWSNLFTEHIRKRWRYK